MIPLRAGADGVSFSVKVHPRAKTNAITGELGDALKLSLTTPPVEGRANQACVEYFAELFQVPRASVTIAAGETGRLKVIRIAGLTREAALKILEGALAGR
ncbi:MAG: YggU family protein [Acidobacteriales bacterium]|nr:YggU family protein [Terriglobales bacterium]